ncbi:MAG: PAS domain-containing protein [Chloroflexi bacterium]|nr:PAS domain-containing protein [Chloroflexota bacterium]
MLIQYTHTTIPLVTVTALLIFLAAYAWNKRHIPGTKVFIILMVELALWSLSHLGEWIFVDPQVKFFWLRIQYFFIATVPILWLLFTLETTGRVRFISPRNVLLLLIIPITTFIGIWTNAFHYFFWQDIALGIVNEASILITSYGPWFWFHATYSYVVLLAGTVVLARAYQRSAHLFRQQVNLLLIGSVAPWIANAITIFDMVPAWDGLDLTPFGFFLTGITMAWGLFRYQLLDIVPIARDVIFDKMAEGVIVLNADLNVVDINLAAESILNLFASEVVGESAPDIFSPWFNYVDIHDKSSSAQYEIHLQSQDELKYYSVNSSPLQDRFERHSGWVMVLLDITEHKLMDQEITRARDEAIAASQIKTRLLANVSHDLRTPLGAILGYTEILQAGIQGEVNPKQYKTLTNIVDSTEQLLNFVNNLIGQAQLETGRLRLNIKDINPEELLSAFQSTAKALARAKGLELHLKIDPNLPDTLSGDPYWLRQIVINLVSNAVKFTEKGDITVEIVCGNDEFWAIKVTDSGEGIPPEFHERIFEPFEQAESHVMDNDLPHGSGLGLSIVRQLATLMGGHVELESELGEGSVFTVFIPWIPVEGESQ